MATFRKRGSGWYAEVRRKGFYKAKTLRSKTAAKMWADAIEDSIDSGKPLGEHTLIDAMRRYARDVSPKKGGARWEKVRLGAFEWRLPFASKLIEDITPDDIGRWRDSRLKDIAPASVRRELVLLAGVFATARREWRWIDVSPMDDVQKPPNSQPRHQTISDAQAEEIKKAAGYWRGMKIRTQHQLVGAAFDFALETAMRAGEIRSLRGDNIDLRGRVVSLEKTKNGSRRQVPLSKGAVEILSALDEEHPFPISGHSLDMTFRRIREKAGLNGAFHFHDTRATAITRLAKKLDVHDLARMTGHKDLKQLLGYYRATASEIASRLD